ncbi:copper radical oxidase [Flagelloscypha sp. PMI_526]|nr:copper radical oxidase [Flagelloscypha sp. PMI_526]
MKFSFVLVALPFVFGSPAKRAIPAPWTLQGCFLDGGTRTLSAEICIAYCDARNYIYSGVEYGRECYCDNRIAPTGTQTPISDCSMPCAGDSTQKCGAGGRLNIYWNGETPPAGPQPLSGQLEGGWSYSGCYVDGAHGRVLTASPLYNSHGVALDAMTGDKCIHACIQAGYSVAGVEFAHECYCDNYLVNAATKVADTDCSMACEGDSSQTCGAGGRLTVYSINGTAVTVLPVPVTQTDNLPGRWKYKGCLQDNGPLLPNKLVLTTNNSATNCLTQCSTYGYPIGGMEYGEECWCGDPTDIANAPFVAESDCSDPCSGDPIHLCGNGNRLSLYEWDGSGGNELYVWHDGTDGNGGRKGYYEVSPGLIVPLIATLGINNKVTFLEKHGTSVFPNSTGGFELDISMIGPGKDWRAAWRETAGLKTDVFCSGSIILPDKGGRQINVGGWSAESVFGVRFYTPDGSPGVPGTANWEENYPAIALQEPRWYPTAAMLPNGSILVIGGEVGSNSAPTPNLEILPKPAGGRTVLEMEWLRRTDPNNLYPFVFILPSGNIFVQYYNEARILNPTTFDTIKELPNAPGSVKDFLAGRTYPLEGAATILPQHAPFTDPMEVLICGGSGIGGNAVGLDNCVSIKPEVPNPTWVIERMPSRRVLTCFAPLPDGTVLILNGAKMGVAGFGLAKVPNLDALLYDPTLPVGHRISKLGSTTIPRMYHSEAILLPDGRVLVSGSDPQDAEFGEELRVEVYVPPYLTDGRAQPTFTITNTDWAYGGSYTITVQGSTANLRVSLMSAVSSTHGNTMGAKALFPAFSCSGSTCTITAPPNSFVSPPGWHQLFILDGPTPSHSAWVRIGGDPAQLGNWPDLPGFTKPGV